MTGRSLPETLERELDRLFSLPLAEFTAARNALAKSLRASGDREAADRVQALAKPSVTAWAVNALYHHERERFDALLRAASAVRAALAGDGDRRTAEADRRQALRALLRAADRLLAEAGHAVSSGNRQRISHTLETLAARDPAEDGPRPGRLASDLEPRGFDVLAGLAASLPPPRRVAPGPTRRARGPSGDANGRSAVGAARDQRLEVARLEVDARQAELTGLETAAEEAAAAAAEALERHERLREEAAEEEAAARQELAAARAAANQAKAARRRGRSRLERARRQLARLEA